MDMYKRAKIYSIRSYQTDDLYIGSTCNELYVRLGQHRIKYKQYLNGKYPFVTSYHILQYNDHYVELIEKFPCDSKMELLKREGEIIRQTPNCVNKCISGRSRSEWREENKEKLLEQKKEYYNENRDKILEQRKLYRENNKEKILEWCNKNRDYYKEYNKLYRNENKEYFKLYRNENKEYHKKYCEKNRETIAKKRKEKIKCEICNCEISRNGLSHHNRTKKHLNNSNINIEEEDIQ